jgi:uncharacterized LabA/DUF88 family protein
MQDGDGSWSNDVFLFMNAQPVNWKAMSKRTVWLIDMGYITKASKGRGRVDYIATKAFLETRFEGDCLPIIFNSIDRARVDLGLKQFYYTVKQKGFIVNLYQMEGGAQKQVDVAIGAHLVFYAMKGFDIVLSSGDIDFLPALELSKKEIDGTAISLLTYRFGVHQELTEIASDHLFFEDHPELILANKPS